MTFAEADLRISEIVDCWIVTTLINLASRIYLPLLREDSRRKGTSRNRLRIAAARQNRRYERQSNRYGESKAQTCGRLR